MCLCVGLHVGVIALGNALGNGIVREIKAAEFASNVSKMNAHDVLQAKKAHDERMYGLAREMDAHNALQTRKARDERTQMLANELKHHRKTDSTKPEQIDSDTTIYQTERVKKNQGIALDYPMPLMGVCTPDNPFGLTKSQMIAISLNSASDVTRSRIADRLAYDEKISGGHKLEAQPSDWKQRHMDYLSANSDEAKMRKLRDDSTGFVIGKGVNEGLMLAAFKRAPVKTATLAGGVKVGSDLYHNKDEIQKVLDDVQSNGGFTLAVGATPSYTALYQQGAAAAGLWVSYDSLEKNFSMGGYLSGEYGPYKARNNMTFDFGLESILFTSPDYQGALEGSYQVFGGGYNSSSVSYIRAAEGKIDGYQYTYDFNRFSKSTYDYKHDVNTYGSFGIGTYSKFWD